MTGLDIKNDALIEVAALVTDSELNILGDGVDVVIKPDDAAVAQMSDFVAAIWPASRAIVIVKVSMSRQFSSLPKGSSVSTLASSMPNSPSAIIAIRRGDHQPLILPTAKGSESTPIRWLG